MPPLFFPDRCGWAPSLLFFLHHFLGKVGLAMEQKVPGNGRQKKKEITTAAARSFFLLLQRGLY